MEKVRKLSRREIECIQLKALGYTDKESAKILGIKYCTYRDYIDRAKLKLACKNVAQLALILNAPA